MGAYGYYDLKLCCEAADRFAQKWRNRREKQARPVARMFTTLAALYRVLMVCAENGALDKVLLSVYTQERMWDDETDDAG